MKIVISENQLNNISLNKNWILDRVKTNSKKIVVTESQYSKLLLKEESCAKGSNCGSPSDVTSAEPSGWSTKDGKYSTRPRYGDFTVGGELVNVKHLCGWYNSKCYGCQPNKSWGYNLHDSHGAFTGKGKWPNDTMRKFVETIWDLGYQEKGKGHNWKTDAGDVYDAGIKRYIELIKNGKIKKYYIKKGSELEGDERVEFSNSNYNSFIIGLKGLNKALFPYGTGPGSFPRMCGQGTYKTDWGPIGDFVEWVGTWDAQDWIDAAALVAFTISVVFPPAAIIALPIAVGLEATNVGISSYKLAKGEGSWGDVGLRTLFLFGGPIIGRSIGWAFKAGKKMASKLFQWATEALGIGAKTGGKKGAQEMGEFILSKNLSQEETKIVERWIKIMKENPEELRSGMEEMSDLLKRAGNGDKAALEILEKRAAQVPKAKALKDKINPFSKVKDKTIKGWNGKTYKVNEYVEELLNPFGTGLSAKIGVGLADTIFIGFKGLEFATWLEAQKIPEELGKELQDKFEKSSEIKKLIKEMREKNLNVPKDATLKETVLEYSTKVDEKTFKTMTDKLQKEMDASLTKFKNKYQEGVKHIKNIRSQKGKLYKTFNSFCESLANYPNALDPVTIDIERTPKQKREMNKVVKNKGVKFKNYMLVFDDKFNGIYEKRGNEWVNVISDCGTSNKVITDFCKSGDKNAKVFCNNVKLDSITLKDYNEIVVKNIDLDAERQSIDDILNF